MFSSCYHILPTSQNEVSWAFFHGATPYLVNIQHWTDKNWVLVRALPLTLFMVLGKLLTVLVSSYLKWRGKPDNLWNGMLIPFVVWYSSTRCGFWYHYSTHWPFTVISTRMDHLPGIDTHMQVRHCLLSFYFACDIQEGLCPQSLNT